MRKVSLRRTLIVCSTAVAAFAIASSASAQTAPTASTATAPTTTSANKTTDPAAAAAAAAAVPVASNKKVPNVATKQMISEAIQRSQARSAKFLASGVPEQWGSEEPFTFNPAAAQ